MRTVDLIYAKRQGRSVPPEAITEMIREYVAGRVPDYQVAAFLMAVFFRGMSTPELSALVNAMLHSGEVYDWSDVPGVKADKHSTGGVGDKVSLPLAPLAAACGLVIPMVSGRGLGHTGGTLDKLEAIKGFNVFPAKAQVRRQLKKIGVAMMGQSDRFVPADKKLYALRDVTATVESVPLICASIMSKKLGEGAEVLVLDIKTGNGAFMAEEAQARELGKLMVALGREMGRKVAALLTDMSQPLGWAIGHANEVAESIDCLKGEWPADLKAVTYALTGRMLVEGGLAKNMADATAQMDKAIANGSALERLRQLIEAQGGEPRVIDSTKYLPLAPSEAVVTAPQSGYLSGFATREIGIALAVLGGGRQTKEDKVDHGVSFWVHHKLGDKVEAGEPMFTVRYRKGTAWQQARPMLEGAITITPRKKPLPTLLGDWL